MKKANMIRSLDGKKEITVEEFDELFDSGSDEIDNYIDWKNGYRPGLGGARPGAGRKPSGRVPYLTRLDPRVIRKIKQRARKQKVSQCELVESVLKRAFA